MVNIKGLKGLSAEDRDAVEKEYLQKIAGWNDFSEEDKDYVYRNYNAANLLLD